MGETRVDLYHLLEDLRDAYPGSTEETILTEIIANSLDSGATTITIDTDPTTRALTIVDDGVGMRRRELARYHDIASSTTSGPGRAAALLGLHAAPPPLTTTGATPVQPPSEEAPATTGAESPPPAEPRAEPATGHLASGPRTRRPLRYGLGIQFESRHDDAELAHLVDSTVWVNEAHPAYRRAVASRSEGYHIALAVALALAPLAVDPVKEHAFIISFLARWGTSIERRRGGRRR